MTFLIRSISRSAAGAEIVRERHHAGDSVTAGRDPANAIHLPDLAVRPRHANIVRTGQRQLLIEAMTDLPLLTGGEPVKRHQATLTGPLEVLIGDYRLLLRADENSEDIVIDVTRVETETIDNEEAARRFSLAGAAPSKRLLSYGLIALVLGLFLVWPILSFNAARPQKLTSDQLAAHARFADASWSSGPLSAAHAGLAQNCKACHVASFTAVPDNACATCHKDVHVHADPARLARAGAHPGLIDGLKQKVAASFGRTPGRCVDCHLEHQGHDVPAANDQRFCSNCHADLRKALPDTKLGDAGDFGRSHPELRPLVMIEPGAHPKFARKAMDTNPKESGALKFPHDLHLSKTGAVARMAQTMGTGPIACASCHVPNDSGARFKPVSMEKNCQGCHSLAFDRQGGTVRTLRHGDVAQVIADVREHAASGLPGFVPTQRRRPGEAASMGYTPARLSADGAVRALFSEGGACYDCHVIEKPAGGGYRVVPVQQQPRYLEHGWFDHDRHRSTACTSCHAAGTSHDARDLLLPKLETCRSCHAGEGASPPKVASTCVSCHDYHRSGAAPRGRRKHKGPEQSASLAPLHLPWEAQDADRAGH